MTQSKKPDFESTVNIEELDLSGLMEDDTITINLDDTHGTTTTYWAGDSITDVVYSGSNDGTFTIDINDLTTDTIDISTMDDITLNNYSHLYESTTINQIEVEQMCNHYPALEKAWRNFKSIYDLVQQDYKGKQKVGEIEDDNPF
jgi:hypothetical protein